MWIFPGKSSPGAAHVEFGLGLKLFSLLSDFYQPHPIFFESILIIIIKFLSTSHNFYWNYSGYYKIFINPTKFLLKFFSLLSNFYQPHPIFIEIILIIIQFLWISSLWNSPLRAQFWEIFVRFERDKEAALGGTENKEFLQQEENSRVIPQYSRIIHGMSRAGTCTSSTGSIHPKIPGNHPKFPRNSLKKSPKIPRKFSKITKNSQKFLKIPKNSQKFPQNSQELPETSKNS